MSCKVRDRSFKGPEETCRKAYIRKASTKKRKGYKPGAAPFLVPQNSAQDNNEDSALAEKGIALRMEHLHFTVYCILAEQRPTAVKKHGAGGRGGGGGNNSFFYTLYLREGEGWPGCSAASLLAVQSRKKERGKGRENC